MTKKALAAALTMMCLVAQTASGLSRRPAFSIPLGPGKGRLSFVRGAGSRPNVSPGPLAANSKEVAIVDRVRKCLNVYDYSGRLSAQAALPAAVLHMAYDERGRLFLLSPGSLIYCYTRSKGFEEYMTIPAQKKQAPLFLYCDAGGRLAANGMGIGFVVDTAKRVEEYPGAYVLPGPEGSVLKWSGSTVSRVRGAEVMARWNLGEDNMMTLIPLGADSAGRVFVAGVSGKAWRARNLFSAAEALGVDFNTPFMTDDTTVKRCFAVRADGAIVYMNPGLNECPVYVISGR